MKLSLTLLLSSLLSASATNDVTPSRPISANSDLGRSLLSQARRVDEADEEDAMTWVTDYSLVFQGCYAVKQWNDDADDESEVRVLTKRLVRFRMCRSSSCSMWCKTGYGDYIVDMSTFVDAFAESQSRAVEYKCQTYLYKNCDCAETDDRGDDWNKDYCEYDCFNDANKDECIDRNPYTDDSGDESFEIERYTECAEFELPEYDDDGNNNNNNNGERRLDDADDAIQYYIGPYCANQGGKIFMGMFTDETCTEFADKSNGRNTFKDLNRGESLPYSTESIVNTKCISCLEPEDPNRQYEQNDDENESEDEIRVAEICEQSYEAAGKCEYRMGDNGPEYPNDNACNFISGVKIVRKDGLMYATHPNHVVTGVIVLFAVSFAAIGYYVIYLRKRLNLKTNFLLE